MGSDSIEMPDQWGQTRLRYRFRQITPGSLGFQSSLTPLIESDPIDLLGAQRAVRVSARGPEGRYGTGGDCDHDQYAADGQEDERITR
jgi:hypothetical protein